MAAARQLAPLTEAESSLVAKHLRLVPLTLARMGVGRGWDREDIEQDGFLGLMRAAQTFDPESGFKFSTWASVKIRSAVLDEMRRRRGGRKSIGYLPPVSLDAPLDDGGQLGDVVADPDVPFEDRIADADLVRRAMEFALREPKRGSALRASLVWGGCDALAAEQGVTPSAVSLRLMKAREALGRAGFAMDGGR